MIGRIVRDFISQTTTMGYGRCHGVAYELQVPMTTCYRLPELGESTTLYTHLVVREDAHLLFGFSDLNERELFRELIKVNGIGPKVALVILSGMEVSMLLQCIMENNIAAFVRLPGIGKKTAERLLI